MIKEGGGLIFKRIQYNRTTKVYAHLIKVYLLQPIPNLQGYIVTIHPIACSVHMLRQNLLSANAMHLLSVLARLWMRCLATYHSYLYVYLNAWASLAAWMEHV